VSEIEDKGPVDGYTVEVGEDGAVRLTFSDRYGNGDRYTFTRADAAKVGAALLLGWSS
jgi:hypothetical protein